MSASSAAAAEGVTDAGLQARLLWQSLVTGAEAAVRAVSAKECSSSSQLPGFCAFCTTPKLMLLQPNGPSAQTGTAWVVELT
jgi:hypothetical protein